MASCKTKSKLMQWRILNVRLFPKISSWVAAVCRCAGCMAAAANGVGIVGIAPEAQIVAVRVATADGFFFPAATVCAFMHAASVGIDVTSNRHVALT